MDIEHLIDRLEELFSDSLALPFTNSVIVNEDQMLNLIDQMRITIPEEIKKAQATLNERDRILAKAQEQANNIIAQARAEAEKLIDKDEITRMAKVRAEQIITQAQNEMEAQRLEADEYAMQTLAYLEGELQRLLKQAQDGIIYLQRKHGDES